MLSKSTNACTRAELARMITEMITLWEEHGEEYGLSIYEYSIEIERRLKSGEDFDTAIRAPFK